LNRVPELPNAHDGSSMRCARSNRVTVSWWVIDPPASDEFVLNL
jgi:hypothetical protein